MNITENRTYVRTPFAAERERSYDNVLTLDSEAKFWSKVNFLAPNGCWEWSGKARTEDGYGTLRLGGRQLRTHRVAYATYVGDLPVGHLVRHKCDNPPCVNPAHLEIGSPTDNVRDREARGRGRWLVGDSHPQSKPKSVRTEAMRLVEDGWTHRSAGLAVGASQSTVSRWVKLNGA